MAQTLLLVPLSLSRALLAGAVGSKLQRPRGQGSRSRSASMVSPAPKRATWKSAFPGRRSLGIEHQQREVPGPDHSPRGRVLTLFTRRGEATSSPPGNRKRGSAAGRPAPLQRGPLHCLLSRPGGASGPHPEARGLGGQSELHLYHFATWTKTPHGAETMSAAMCSVLGRRRDALVAGGAVAPTCSPGPPAHH